MADEERTILIDVEIEDQDFDKEIGKVNNELQENQKLIRELKKDYSGNSEEIAKLELRNKELSSSKRDLIKQSQTEANSLNALRLKLANLTKERNNTNTSTKEGAARFKELQKEIAATTDEVKGFEEEGGDFRRSIGKYKDAIKGLGLALKALGIGLIIKAVQSLTDKFKDNQRFADLLSTAVNVLGSVLDDVVTFIVDNASLIGEFFSNPIESIDKLKTAIKEGIQNRINQLLESLGFLGTAFTKLFEGDFSGALDAAKEAARQFADVVTGKDGTVDAVVKYGTELIKTARSQTELTNASALAEVQQKRIQQQLERQAELQRQIRDDESRSFAERIAANDRLGEILEEQSQAELALLETRVKLAQLNFDQNQNLENEIALNESLLEQEDALNRIEGQRSEQIVNRIALEREQQEEQDANTKKTKEDEKAISDLKDKKAKEDADRAKALKDLKLKAEQETLNGLISIFGQATAAGKGFALTQIAFDTARAISVLVRNSEANPANAVTFGVAGIAQFVAGLARIATNIGKAKQILDSGGSAAVPSATDRDWETKAI